jgi:hypothetical protein
MASLRESDAEDSLNSALLGILLRRIRFSPNEKCCNSAARFVADFINTIDPQQTSVASNGYLPLVAQARARAATLQINFFLQSAFARLRRDFADNQPRNRRTIMTITNIVLRPPPK